MCQGPIATNASPPKTSTTLRTLSTRACRSAALFVSLNAVTEQARAESNEIGLSEELRR